VKQRLHGLDLLLLLGGDGGGDGLHVGAVGVLGSQLGHLDGLLVVGDHALNELDVGLVVLLGFFLARARGQGKSEDGEHGDETLHRDGPPCRAIPWNIPTRGKVVRA